MRWILLSLFVLSFEAHAQWERMDTYLLSGALGLMAIDWGQTRDLSTRYHDTYATPACADPSTRTIPLAGSCPATRVYDHYEINPLLPAHPTNSQVDQYFAIAMIGTAGLSYVLPTRYRRPFLGAVIVLESLVVLHNHSLGLRISF
jgi:hypothetical protein